jgi:hypothetical protein
LVSSFSAEFIRETLDQWSKNNEEQEEKVARILSKVCQDDNFLLEKLKERIRYYLKIRRSTLVTLMKVDSQKAAKFDLLEQAAFRNRTPEYFDTFVSKLFISFEKCMLKVYREIYSNPF